MPDDKSLIQSLCDLEIPSAIKFSPDGQKVLYSTALTWGHRKGHNAVSTLWLGSTGQSNSSRPLTAGSSKDYAPAWHPDGQSIAFISDRTEAGNKWAIYVLPLPEGSEAYPITVESNEMAIEMFRFSPDGKHIAFLSADEKTLAQKDRERNNEDVQVWGQEWPYARLRIVDVHTKKIRSLNIDRHVADLCWSQDSKSIGIVSCKSPDIEEILGNGAMISTVDLGLTAVRDLCKVPRADFTALTWANDGKLYFRLGVPADKLYAGHGVYVTDPDSQSFSYDKVSFGVVDDVVGLMRATNGEILAKVEHRLESRICSLSGQVLFSRKEALEDFDAASASGDGKMIFAVATSSVNHPVEVYTTTTNGDALAQLSNHGQALSSREFGTCDFLLCPSTDGQTELEAIYLTPASSAHDIGSAKRSKALPTVVMIHGGPNLRIVNAFNTYYYMWAPYLLSLGYGILLPNYRGSSGRGEKFASFSIDGVGKYDYEDVIAITQHAIEQGFADRDKMLVCGWSQGGFLSCLCSVRNGSHGYGWRFRAAIAGAGICDSDSMALGSDLGSVFQPEINNGRVTWNMDKEDTRNRRASPLWEFNAAIQRSKQKAEMVIPPILILHGEKDARCPVSQAWGLRRALQSQDLPFEFVTYPRQGHFFTERFFWIDMAVRIGRWCDRYIGVESRDARLDNRLE